MEENDGDKIEIREQSHRINKNNIKRVHWRLVLNQIGSITTIWFLYFDGQETYL